MKDSDRELEELLSGAVFELDPDFQEKLLDRLRKNRNSTMRAEDFHAAPRPDRIGSRSGRLTQKARWVSLALLGLAVVLMVSVPGVRAGSLRLILHYYQVIFARSQSIEILNTFQPLTPSFLPSQLTGSAFWTQESPEAASFEMRYFSQQEFVIIHQIPANLDEPLPTGEKIRFNGQVGILENELSGVVQLVSPVAQPGHPNGPGGGGGGWDLEGTPPSVMAYSGAIQLTWVQSGVRVQMLSNLSIDEVLKLAQSMQSAVETPAETPVLE